MRVLAVFLAAMFFRILSVSVSPTVGWPSVKNTMLNDRPASSPRYASAVAIAPSMAVPPFASSFCTHFLASATCSGVESSSVARYLLTVVEKLISAKRSLGPRWSRQYFKALRACSILTPRMLPDVSRTSTMSRGTTYSFGISTLGVSSMVK